MGRGAGASLCMQPQSLCVLKSFDYVDLYRALLSRCSLSPLIPLLQRSLSTEEKDLNNQII